MVNIEIKRKNVPFSFVDDRPAKTLPAETFPKSIDNNFV